MTEKILVHVIEGAESWVPIDAQEISTYQYMILNDSEYEDIDIGTFFEFYPGDIVVVEDAFDEEYQFKALKISSFGGTPTSTRLNFFIATTKEPGSI
jgi:hypothetical protein